MFEIVKKVYADRGIEIGASSTPLLSGPPAI